jgi:quercetin dioxygenase-like cupin family protein
MSANADNSENSENSDNGRRFAVGDGLQATILTTAAETDGRLDVVDGYLPPGATTPLHLHTVYEERYWVVEGSMTVWAGDDETTLRAGDYYTVPTNVAHAVRSGPEGSRALILSSPAGFAELIERAGVPADRRGAEAAFDPERFMAVTTELGDVVLGPPGTTPADIA